MSDQLAASYPPAMNCGDYLGAELHIPKLVDTLGVRRPVVYKIGVNEAKIAFKRSDHSDRKISTKVQSLHLRTALSCNAVPPMSSLSARCGD